MKPYLYRNLQLLASPLLRTLPSAPDTRPLPQLIPNTSPPGESVRHILLGTPGAVRQTIHLLHSLHYSETVLWSPIVAVEEPLIITPAQGEAVSLLRRAI
ncbi:hypothetical protein [Leptolyngbya sp. BC1307]|uniref:hypothetical protein n=1 Tax=Leptolyngbya sp. BC1307 TaxID=2029589 RepID=UPI001F0A44A0|nr:hypothetical protein [Leptolyngbya sp. BC1307]